ncbi:MAG: hypothetical protein H6Q06_2633, partial [Acidobacteria bacterium]|nr:hypothetical protein [Acidobacteriota bacterium]
METNVKERETLSAEGLIGLEDRYGARNY